MRQDDDAKNYQMVSWDHAMALTLCFDHATIISDARKKGMIP
jgi:hypothetical protein